jgi:cell wall-associated NlpC family hydrolase
MAKENVTDYENLLTAGVGELFYSTLSADQYMEIAKEAEGARWGYTNLGICNVEENNLNIRQTPGEDGKLVGKLPKNAACEIVESDGEWAYIQSGKVEGYVKEEYLLSGFAAEQKAREVVKTIAVSSADALNVREEPNTDAEVVTQVAKGEELEIAEVMENGWIKVYLDDEEVYVSADYAEVKSELATAITMTELLYGQGVSDVRVDLCQYAKQFLGNPYVWGGTSLTKGADCSGFVQSVFKKYGVSLPRTSREQANAGTTIQASQLQPGDLIFYAKGGTINHVAIYIGNGQVIHASSPKTGIKISSYNYRTPAKMVRILQD